MAQTVQTGQVTPADELRGLLVVAEKRVANVRGNPGSALALLKELDRIAVLWPVLEAQGMDLRPEAGRWETLQASVDRRAGAILSELSALGSIEKLRREIHPEGTSAAWWRLDELVRANNRRRAQRIGLILGGLVVLGAVLYSGLRLLFPVDPKVVESNRRSNNGEQLIQAQSDFSGALAEFQQAAQLTPDDPEAWLRVGAVHEKLGDPAAQEAFARARALVADEVAFQQTRASIYLMFGMIEQADRDLQAALAERPDDPVTWYELASVFEMRGEIREAINALDKADQYATGAGQVQLSATARYRRGMLMQQLGFQQQPEATDSPGP